MESSTFQKVITLLKDGDINAAAYLCRSVLDGDENIINHEINLLRNGHSTDIISETVSQLEGLYLNMSGAAELPACLSMAYFIFGRYFVGKNMGDKAIPYLEKALSVDPTFSEAVQYLASANTSHGWHLITQDRDEEAILFLERAAAVFPNDQGLRKKLFLARARLGSALVDQKRPREGLPHLERARVLDPQNPHVLNNLALAHNNIGETLMGMGNAREALPHFEQALSINRESFQFIDNLIYCRHIIGNPVVHQVSGSLIDKLKELTALFDGITPWSGIAPKNFLVNFIGARTCVDFFRNASGVFAKDAHNKEWKDVVAGPRYAAPPVPEVAQGEAFFEIAAVLRSVRTARDRYVMIELGGGYAARAVDALVALRQLNPMPARTVIVEPVQQHIDFAKKHFLNNDLSCDDHWFLPAVVGLDHIPQLMPLGSGRYGNTINNQSIKNMISDVSKSHEGAKALVDTLVNNKQVTSSNGEASFGFVSSVTLADILFGFDVVDLIDVDIQGYEIHILPAAIDLLKRKVRLMNIGTHSASIHGLLSSVFQQAGWNILGDWPPFMVFETPLGNFKTGDGVLLVENPSIHRFIVQL